MSSNTIEDLCAPFDEEKIIETSFFEWFTLW